MQLLLSCAKTMTERSSVPTPRTTRPAYRSEASELAAGLATLPTDELARLLRVNRRIAAENRLRYGRFHGDDDAAIPALTAYTGIVFKRIDPASFTDADFEYAQRHLNITSFLYGLLRPLDAIRTYRLEGDAVLPGRGDETMFSYWQSRLTDDLLGRIQRLGNLGAERTLADSAGEGTHHVERHVGVEQRAADFTDRAVDIRLGKLALALQMLERIRESVCQR